jgi:hypothetical protein
MKKYVSLTLALVVATATLASAGVYLVGGSYTGGNTIPFWAARPGMRWQTIWDKSRILEGGPVSKVELISYPTGISAPSTFSTCKILLCNTPLTHVTTSYTGNYGGQTPVTVFSGTKVVPAMGGGVWWTVVSPTNFTYNRTYNLLIEVSWVSGSGNRSDFQVNSRGSHGRIYAYSATATTGSVTTNYDQLGRITIGFVGVEPTSLGRVKSIFK